MTADKNKSIYITYNHLNLPYLVQKTTGDNILYYYDATGRKLSQQVTGSSFNAVKKTDYAGSYFYENDTLKFINHAGPPELQRRREEGRVIMTGPTKEYQYNLKDHLGNVRTTFTTKDETIVTTATLEASNMLAEKSQYLRYDEAKKVYSTLLDNTNGALPGYSQRLNGTVNEKYGLAKSLSVMPGDVIQLEVYAKYLDPSRTNWTGTIFETLVAQIAAHATGVVINGITYNSSSASFPTGFGTLTSKDDNGAPKAYLNWLIFDRNYQFITGGFKQISQAAKETGTGTGFEWVHPSQGDIIITDAGYLYAYLSNESLTQVEVYFDDFKVTHVKSPVIATNDYYPFGLAFNSYSRENSTSQDYKYNGKEEQNELGLGWLDYGARMYMPEIGRWITIDPFVDRFNDVTPYSYTNNNPLNHIDLDGRELIPVNQRREFRQAIRYLKQSATGRKIIRYLESRDERILIGTQDTAAPNPSFYTIDGGASDYANLRISWNAYNGRQNSNGSKSSPALGLIHELAHMYYSILGDESHSNRTEDDQYENSAERKAISDGENVVAKELNNGEGTREDHKGDGFWTTSPTSTQNAGQMPARAAEIRKDAIKTGAMNMMRQDAGQIENRAERRQFKRERRSEINKAINRL